jgi:2-C-methyl-D-erythritol 2,4-cyclodiphosphate synthase
MPTDPPIHRIGLGTDLHRLVAGRPLKLGGVTVPHTLGALGHSDADVVFHAVADALLGAAGLPDIGEQFPDDDPRFQDADSASLLAEAVRLAVRGGFRVACVDIVVQAERPKLAAYKTAIRNNVACVLAVEPGCVNVKAKTNEGVDAVGRGEAIAAHAIALLRSRS